MGDKISFVDEYINQVSGKYETGYAREDAYRIPLEKLLKSLVPDIEVVNDPKHVAKSLRPDFIIFTGKKHDILGGYIEAKDIDKINLDDVEKSDQLAKKYLPALSDLILTNYLEFRRYINGEKVETIEIGKLDKKNKKIDIFEEKFSHLVNLLTDFIRQPADKTIESADQLSDRLASKCKLLKEQILVAKDHEKEVFETENPTIKAMQGGVSVGPLFDFYKSYRKMLTGDIDDEEYSDNLAQTFIYSLFSARMLVPDSELKDFSFKTALEYLPKTVPFLHSLYSKMQEFRRMGDIENIEWVLSDLTSILRQADMESVLSGFGRLSKNEDPIIHFYEGFLKSYDKGLRKDRGVWYTPKPIVKYIVDSIDIILKEKFGKKKGFADKDVIILDPACGTGTFLAEVIEKCKETIDEGIWNKFVNENLLERLYGFEIMVAPYAISHLKLALSLTHYQQEDYTLGKLMRNLPDNRINVVLTNTLEKPSHKLEFSKGSLNPLEKEALLADSVKRDKKVMVVLGNPPYSVSTQNKNKWIDGLIGLYKKGLKEKKTNIDDDYIKFIRFAQWRIENTGHGVVGMVTNNSFYSGVTHREMRKSLLKDYDQIHILDLHGNSLLKETTPEGSPDQNVFDIRQGVGISICERYKDHKGDKEADVYYGDLWGRRKKKYEYLESMNLKKSIENDVFEKLHLSSDYKFFVKKDFSMLEEYDKFTSITDIIPEHGAGVKTERDRVSIHWDLDSAKKVVNNFLSFTEKELRSKYNLLKDSRDWKLGNAIKDLVENQENNCFTEVLYRPFDIRSIWYSGKSRGFVGTPGYPRMKHMLLPNIGFIGKRARMINTVTFQHFSVTSGLLDINYLADQTYCFPLYLYIDKYSNSPWKKTGLEVEVSYGLPKPEKQTVYRVPNLYPEIIRKLEENLCLEFATDGKGDLKKTFGPEDLYAYIYAILHSQTYRKRYEEFLKIDFPKIPVIDNTKAFLELVKIGEELIELHLMNADLPLPNQTKVSFKGIITDKKNDCLVEEVRYVNGRIYINKDQYFESISESTWNFMVGGYQVCHKWLKDRKGRKHDDVKKGKGWSLSTEEIDHYKYIIYALEQTQLLMGMIDDMVLKFELLSTTVNTKHL